MNIESIKNKIKSEKNKAFEKLKSLKTASEIEVHDTYVAAEILLMFIEKKPVTEEEIKFLKEQSIDFVKVLAIIGLQAVPGSSVAIILLEKIGEKHGFKIFPNPQKAPDLKNDSSAC